MQENYIFRKHSVWQLILYSSWRRFFLGSPHKANHLSIVVRGIPLSIVVDLLSLYVGIITNEASDIPPEKEPEWTLDPDTNIPSKSKVHRVDAVGRMSQLLSFP